MRIAKHPYLALAACFGLYLVVSDADYSEAVARDRERVEQQQRCARTKHAQPLIATHFARADGGQSTLICTYGQHRVREPDPLERMAWWMREAHK